MFMQIDSLKNLQDLEKIQKLPEPQDPIKRLAWKLLTEEARKLADGMRSRLEAAGKLHP
jgi:hypothetical protein